MHTCDCPRSGGTPSIPCRAAHHLWCAYHDWRGCEWFGLCARLGIPVVRQELKPFRAYLHVDEQAAGGARIILPEAVPHDASAREGLLVYHELGHYVLRRDDEFFRHVTRWTPTPFAVEEESWCDAFAAAMLLASFGWKPFGLIREGHAYLRLGEKLGRPRNDLFLARRLRQGMRKPRRRGSLPPAPLHRLARDLVAHAYAEDKA